MEKVIFKYTLTAISSQTISLPKGYEILTIQTQFNAPQIWVLVNPNEQEKEELTLDIYGTGHPIYYDMGIDKKYLATYQIDDGNYVFHVFKRN